MSRLHSRRAALKVSVASLATVALAACAGKTSGQITQQVVTYAGDIANGLANFAKNAVNLPNAAVIAGYAADAATAANALNTSLSLTKGQPVVAQISSDVAAVANAVQGMSLSAQAAAILQDIVLALQILLPLVGLLAPAMPPVPGSPASALANLHVLPTTAVDGVAVSR